ncbi:hypothetical protein BT96DRAFT_984304 [Gymnopus androsaceus JB14]|uniref:Uncharacterized protein n=1 Tax=Gymnopus androsaceus JB14 TaxID=1447944 RepID=A0A6A4ILJ0_9AGAR|nr:hypothetical protein BT96DRAFT_984304 [Gymnopus androsaceus JB14]
MALSIEFLQSRLGEELSEQGPVSSVGISKLSNLCSMEMINEIPPFFVHAMRILTHLHRDPLAGDDQLEYSLPRVLTAFALPTHVHRVDTPVLDIMEKFSV